jgi:hypothetical protein
LGIGYRSIPPALVSDHVFAVKKVFNLIIQERGDIHTSGCRIPGEGAGTDQDIEIHGVPV